MLYFDATAVHAVSGLQVTDLELVEGTARVARANGPIDLRISLPGRDRDQNFVYAAFDGAIAAGATLRLCASIELTTLPQSCTPSSCRYRATMMAVSSDGGEEKLVLEGSLDDPWPTAGPARVRSR